MQYPDRSDRVQTYREIAQKCDASASILQSMGLRFHPTSTLGKLFKAAQTLADDWDTESAEGRGIKHLIDVGHASRIADAVLAVSNMPSARICLERITKKDVDLAERAKSPGKDALWEIELFSRFVQANLPAQFIEPPDLIATLPFGNYAFACKKVYSDANVEKQMQSGCRQITKSGLPGIVAFNLDDTAPARSLVVQPSASVALEALAHYNAEFIDRHKRQLSRFVNERRCDGVLVSTSIPADLEGSSPRFNNLSQTTLWALRGSDESGLDRLASFSHCFSAIMY
jgi:hypothetical protein